MKKDYMDAQEKKCCSGQNTATTEEIGRLWDSLADWYAEMVFLNGEPTNAYIVEPEIRRHFEAFAPRKLLDAACGPAMFSAELAGQGWQVTGVDISSRMIDHARTHANRADHPEIRFLRADVTSRIAELGDGTFDLVLCNLALMSIPNFERAIGEFSRVLRRNGTLIFSICHPCFDDPGATWTDANRFNVTGYFDICRVQTRLKNWNTGVIAPVEWPHFRRPISDYIQALLVSGFTIVSLAEPRPTSEGLELWPDYLSLFDRYPGFLVIRAIRN